MGERTDRKVRAAPQPRGTKNKEEAPVGAPPSPSALSGGWRKRTEAKRGAQAPRGMEVCVKRWGRVTRRRTVALFDIVNRVTRPPADSDPGARMHARARFCPHSADQRFKGSRIPGS